MSKDKSMGMASALLARKKAAIQAKQVQAAEESSVSQLSTNTQPVKIVSENGSGTTLISRLQTQEETSLKQAEILKQQAEALERAEQLVASLNQKLLVQEQLLNAQKEALSSEFSTKLELQKAGLTQAIESKTAEQKAELQNALDQQKSNLEENFTQKIAEQGAALEESKQSFNSALRGNREELSRVIDEKESAQKQELENLLNQQKTALEEKITEASEGLTQQVEQVKQAGAEFDKKLGLTIAVTKNLVKQVSDVIQEQADLAVTATDAILLVTEGEGLEDKEGDRNFLLVDKITAYVESFQENVIVYDELEHAAGKIVTIGENPVTPDDSGL
jgi:hypothetical protein